MGLRAFIVTSDDHLTKLPIRTLERLLASDPGTALPEHAGKRVKYLLVFTDTWDRRPIAIRRIDPGFLDFDAVGRLDASAFDTQRRLAVNLLPPLFAEPQRSVVDAEHRFGQRKYDHRYRWKPSQRLLQQVQRMVVGR